jgi:PAS domain S-box-containing protein
MDTDRNLLFGVLALQADLIDPRQFVEACTLWATCKDVPLAELLIERGWILPADREHVDYLLRRKLHKHGNDIRVSLVTVSDDIKRSLAAVEDADIRRSLVELPRAEAPDLAATVDHIAGPCQRYTRTSLHALGGLGRVWLARDHDLGRDVALKEIRPERGDDAALQARFLQEARITGQLEHPGVVPVYELGRCPDDQQPFYTMRFVKGHTLSEAARTYHDKRLAGKADALALLTLLNAFVAVCNTVAYAHARGVLHRDLKGQNVVLGDFGEVVVLDWGLAKLVDRPTGEESRSPILADPQGSGEGDLTVQGQTVGTPAYMAPEQAAGRPDLIDRRTDVCGLGAILYEILTGQPPFRGSDTQEVLRKVREEEPVPPRQLWAEVPPTVEAICLRALAKRPEDRHASATELAQEVQHWMAESAERKQADQQRARFFALSLDLMCIAGFDGYFKQLNPAWEKSLGWTTEELQAKPWVEFLHPDDVAPTLASAQKIIAGEVVLFHENRYRCKDGSYRWLQWTGQEIVGEHLIYAMARDITDRKQGEEALRESEERYRSVIAAMKDGIALLDADGSIRACNASAERILGLSADQMMGRTPLDPRWGAICEDGSPFPEEDRPPIVTLRTGQPCYDVIVGVRKPDGTLTWLSVNSQPLFRADGTTLCGVAVSFEDITARKQTEELLRRTAAELTQFKERFRQRVEV